MSSNALVREPSWEGLEPRLPQWRAADPDDCVRMRDMTGMDGNLSVLSFAGIEQQMFRLEARGQLPLFLKQIPPHRTGSALRAEAIARWLAARGIRTATALPGFPKVLGDGGLLIAMPYVAGRRADPTVEDCGALASSVADLHRALAGHLDRHEWRQYTSVRLNELTTIRDACCSGRLVLGPDPVLLRDLAADATIDFVGDGIRHQPLHGDLNPGNVLFAEGSAVLLDFEDVFHSVLPARFELALILERFILVRTDDQIATTLGRIFIETYRARVGEGACDLDFDPVGVLRALALRSLCVLALAESRGTSISRAEWDKFFRLERQARERAQAIRAIFGNNRA
jgi:Ser/Thr protein kinase RdoA (MazF antagonist)